MSGINTTIEIIRNVFNEDLKYVTIKPWADVPDDYVLLCSEGNENIEWFGELELVMSTKFAKQIGQALIDCANELEE